MKKSTHIVIAFFLLLWSVFSCNNPTDKSGENFFVSKKIQEGDILFQTSESRQCEAVQKATYSIYSHCGIVFKDGSQWMVYEAVQPVRKTPLKDWIARGKNNNYVTKRLVESEKILTPEILKRMKSYCIGLLGKNYDLYFQWDDEHIYCSELVWKAYKESTGMEVGKIQHLKDFDFSSDIVKKIMAERYGNNIPYDEKVISPAAIFDSPLLMLVE